jgi:hypothetical protein
MLKVHVSKLAGTLNFTSFSNGITNSTNGLLQDGLTFTVYYAGLNVQVSR